MEPTFRRFCNRIEAGQLLAERLRHLAQQHPVILGLPRGGVPVAAEIAEALGAPLDVFIVRKLGVPGQEELAMGAIADGGYRILNDDIIETIGITPDVIEEATLAQLAELHRRSKLYRAGRSPIPIEDKTVVLVDDGLATGASMRVAVRAVEGRGVARCVVAVPVGAEETCHRLSEEADEVVCLFTPEPFISVGLWYEDFTQTTDEEVRELLQNLQHSRRYPS